MSAIEPLPYPVHLRGKDPLPLEENVTTCIDPLRSAINAYLCAAGGDPVEALRLAVLDAIKSRDEAALATAALDQWTSRGYVRGRASERLAASIRAFIIAPRED